MKHYTLNGGPHDKDSGRHGCSEDEEPETSGPGHLLVAGAPAVEEPTVETRRVAELLEHLQVPHLLLVLPSCEIQEER